VAAAVQEPEPAPAAAAAEGAGMASEGEGRTSVVISGVPGFSRALALQRAFTALPGVVEAKAIGYERGMLGLEVQHDPGADLAALAAGMPGMPLRVVDASSGQLQLSAE
jgi:hypothetical protein